MIVFLDSLTLYIKLLPATDSQPQKLYELDLNQTKNYRVLRNSACGLHHFVIIMTSSQLQQMLIGFLELFDIFFRTFQVPSFYYISDHLIQMFTVT